MRMYTLTCVYIHLYIYIRVYIYIYISTVVGNPSPLSLLGVFLGGALFVIQVRLSESQQRPLLCEKKNKKKLHRAWVGCNHPKSPNLMFAINMIFPSD